MNKRLRVTEGEGFNPKRIRLRTTLVALAAGVVALLFGIAAFLFFLYLFPFVTRLPETYQTKEINWSLLGGITSLATFALFFGGVLFALFDYVQNAIQKKREDAEASFNIYKEIFDRLMNPEALEARRWVIENLHTLEEMNNDKEAWRDHIRTQINIVPRGWKGQRSPGKEYLKEILNTFDFIGFVARHYWNMENELVIWMSPPIAKVWERIWPYVEEEADRRGEPDYYLSAREFAKYCVDWRRKRNLKSKIIKNGM